MLIYQLLMIYIKDPTQVKDVRVPENLQRAMAAEAEAARNARAKVIKLMMLMIDHDHDDDFDGNDDGCRG